METNLYHCTDAGSLTKILKSKCFKLSFCLEQYDFLEDINFMNHQKVSFVNRNMAFAMVCFADLLDAELHNHASKFNSTAYIKMQKGWALKNHLSAVIYCDKNSLVSSGIMKILLENTILLKNRYLAEIESIIGRSGLDENNNITDKEELIKKHKKCIHDIYTAVNILFPYLKKYKGKYYLKDQNKFSEQEVDFFQEREWRYIPLVTNNESYYLEENEYNNNELRQNKENELFKGEYKLNFDWNDILGFSFLENECSDELKKNIANIYNVSIEDVDCKIIT